MSNLPVPASFPALVTTVFISDEAMKILVLEQEEKTKLKGVCDRLAAKRREIRKLQREMEELEQEVVFLARAMSIKGIAL